MNSSLEETDRLLRLHLNSSNVQTTENWILTRSPIGGRGIFATQDLLPGDVVFVDAPLVVGPRFADSSHNLCVGCHRSGVELTPCSRGCGLPVCAKTCEDKEVHSKECGLLTEWQQSRKKNAPWSEEMLKALTPIRCLGLNEDQRSLVRCMEAHTGPLHGREVDLIKQHLVAGPSPEDEAFMRVCCCVMDANAFEIVAQIAPSSADPTPLETSLRGLFPMSAMMNHACTPNTRHGFNKDMCMFVQATKAIPQGTEITTSYFALLWGTTARRHHLSKTKHFQCFCARCKDPQEGGTRLSALKCANDSCPGSLLSEDPIKVGSKWACDVCGIRLPEKQARLIQSGLGTMLRAVNCDDPLQLMAFLRGHQQVFATTNQVVVQLKSCLIWIYGHRPGYMWTELSDLALEVKEKLCREMLILLKLLDAGQCRLRGLFLFELHCTLVELQRRSPSPIKADEASKAIEEAASMFRDDITAPPDLRTRLRASNCVVE